MAPFTKPPQTIGQHIQRLRQRGMVIDDDAGCAAVLEHVGYYRLSGYWLPFERDHATHEFQAGTNFEQVLNLYTFDRHLRLLLMDAIDRVEISVRAKWASVLKFEGGPHVHLNEDFFQPKKNRYGKVIWDHAGLLAKLIEQRDRSNEGFIKHFETNYEEPLPPVWASIELMTLGTFSKWFEATKERKVRQSVSKAYEIDERLMASFLHHLATVRNLCAHHSRVWNRKFTFTFKVPTHPPALARHMNHLNNKQLYNTLTVLVHLINIIAPDSNWRRELLDLIERHGVDPLEMGFPDQYQALPLWQLR